MTRILQVGYDPKTEDASEIGEPVELNAAKIEAAIESGVKQMRQRGWEVDVCLIPFQQAAEIVGARVERQLRSAAYDCVVIGGGIRRPGNYLVLEAVLNAVHSAAPAAAIALNSGPANSAEAVDAGWRPSRATGTREALVWSIDRASTVSVWGTAVGVDDQILAESVTLSANSGNPQAVRHVSQPKHWLIT